MNQSIFHASLFLSIIIKTINETVNQINYKYIKISIKLFYLLTIKLYYLIMVRCYGNELNIFLITYCLVILVLIIQL